MNKLTATINLIKENSTKIVAEIVPYDNDQSLAVVIDLSAPGFTAQQCANPASYNDQDMRVAADLAAAIIDLVKRTLAAHKAIEITKELNVRERRAGMHTAKNLN